MKKSVLGLTAAAVAAMVASGCSSNGTNGPDEFRVVRKAPLSVPPEYNLRPPAVGEAVPAELQSDDSARAILFGDRVGSQASEGERLLVQKADADAIDPKIRAQVDYDATGTLRKSKSLSDKILFFKGDGNDATIIEPANEAQRLERELIDNATGGGDVVIERKAGESKLPGL
ncbi:DUF3035 domain-containing protein [Hirschia baltica]|uniref:DUF3035 domain-containing protein n=1 Tax=Hirschia baltica (strain ATCC 49814 / DSM 5838 / IFAM 1418) TaxID=582402 RepID=C6XQS2_HIRBI|nr:DUF3035 domain-containing protein [Hirschia baltica]ACT58678.1 conserved hypothetical protein [Hirschia baltica ATCC 49814]